MISENIYAKLVSFKLRELRQNSAYTTSEYIDLINFKSRHQLYMCEKGNNKFDLDTLALALKVLNVNVRCFFDELVHEAEQCAQMNSEKHKQKTD